MEGKNRAQSAQNAPPRKLKLSSFLHDSKNTRTELLKSPSLLSCHKYGGSSGQVCVRLILYKKIRGDNFNVFKPAHQAPELY